MSNNLTHFIRDDIRSRILSGRNVPEKITLQSVAKEYNVSLMPVRLALQGLIEEEVLSRSENGRMEINARKAGSLRGKGLKSHPKPPQDIHKAVMKEVLQLSLERDTQGLKIARWAEKYGTSHSLMHTIFHRLAGEGVIEHLPRRGWKIHPFNAQELDAYLDVREALELLALNLSKDKFEKTRLQELLELNRPDSDPGSKSIDNSLHMYWVTLSNNRYILEFFKRHQTYYDLLLKHTVLTPAHIRQSQESHCKILNAILERNWPKASQLLIDDIRRLSPLLKATILRIENAT